MEDKIKASLEAIYLPSEDLVVKEIQGEFVIIPLRRGMVDLEDKFFKLNETAKAMWDKLDGKKTLKEIVQELGSEYDADLELIERELLQLAEGLLKRGMLVQEFSLCGAVTIELIEATFARDALFRFKVKGFSMSPFFQDQDIVTLSPVWRSAVGLGKPVACVCPVHKRLMVHRIVARKGNHYLIKGDNVPQADCLMDKEHILGCVTAIERKNKSIFFSLGLERIIIAFLSRKGLLPAVFFFWRLIPGFLRRFIKCRILS